MNIMKKCEGLMITTIIDDLRTDRRYFFIFGEDDFKELEDAWTKVDQGLLQLHDNPLFKGLKRWCDLAPVHFKSMILNNLSAFLSLPPPFQTEMSHPLTKSLNLVIMGMIKCLEERTDSNLEMVKLKVINNGEMIVEYSAILTADIRSHISSNNFLKIIVDNSDEEDDK